MVEAYVAVQVTTHDFFTHSGQNLLFQDGRANPTIFLGSSFLEFRDRVRTSPRPHHTSLGSMSQQQLERRATLLRELQQGEALASSAGEIARSTLVALEQQSESLRSTEDTLESNEYVLNKSAFVLRGMTWVGWLANKLTTSDGNTRVLEHPGAQSSSSLPHEDCSSSAFRDVGGNDEESESLEKIARHVDELKLMANAMGSHGGEQAATIDRIEGKVERVRDKTLEVTLRAAQLTTRSRRTRERFVGRFQFVDVKTGGFLGAVGEDLVLLRGPSRGSFFDVFEKEEGILGLRNSKTLRFIGMTWTGSVRVSGHYFGRSEECHLANVHAADRNDESGLLVLAKNWAKGGWISRSEGPDQASSPLLERTTACVSDKEGRVVFRSVFVKSSEQTIDMEEEDKGRGRGEGEGGMQ